MSSQIPVTEETKKLTDILRSAQPRNTSFDTIIKALVEEKLNYSKDLNIQHAVALTISQSFVMTAMRHRLVRDYDESMVECIRWILVGNYEPAIEILKGFQGRIKGVDK